MKRSAILCLTLWSRFTLGQDSHSGTLKGLPTPSEALIQILLPVGAADWRVAAKQGPETKAFVFAVGVQLDRNSATCPTCAIPETRQLRDMTPSIVLRGEIVDASRLDPALRLGFLVTARPGQSVVVRVNGKEHDVTPSPSRPWNQIVNGVPGLQTGTSSGFFAELSTVASSQQMMPFDKDGLVLQGGIYFTTPPRMKPRIVKYQLPKVSPPLKETRLQMLVEVDVEGKVSIVSGAAPASELQSVAERAVRTWEFRPMIKAGKAVAVRMPVALVFQADGAVRAVGF